MQIEFSQNSLNRAIYSPIQNSKFKKEIPTFYHLECVDSFIVHALAFALI